MIRVGILLACLGLSGLVADQTVLRIRLSGTAAGLTATIDGASQTVTLDRPIAALSFGETPIHQREIQFDGSDNLNNRTLDPAHFEAIANSPYARLQTAIRDAGGYNRWRDVTVVDRRAGTIETVGRPGTAAISVPAEFDVQAALHRFESPVDIWFWDESGGSIRLLLNRNDRIARFIRIDPAGHETILFERYLPNDWWPAARELLHLALRTAAIAIGLLLLAPLLGLGLPHRAAGCRIPAGTGLAAAGIGLALALGAAIAVFDRTPEILDAISYTFQAKVFAGGALTTPEPPVRDAFPVPFTLVVDGRWFSQYPPGTAAGLAIGYRLGVPWIVHPLLAAAIVWLTFAIARRLYGPGTAAIAGGLIALSPWLAVQSASFLSHVPAAAGAAAFALAAIAYRERPRTILAAAAALALGYLLLTRETTAAIYGLTFGSLAVAAALRRRPVRWLDLGLVAGILLVAVAGSLAYNAALTGHPLLLPRHAFDSHDRFGFGDGVGFWGRHTLAAGLVNTEQNLTALSVWLFGWPFYVALAVIALPFATGRTLAWDWLWLAIAAIGVVAYVAYFYHGIANGPRYYFDALPALAILAARGLNALAADARDRLAEIGRSAGEVRARRAVGVVTALLIAADLVYFLPRQVAIYRDRFGLAADAQVSVDGFFGADAAGRTLPFGPAILAAEGWETYVRYLAAQTCPRLDCPAIVAAWPGDDAARARLRATFPDRPFYRVVIHDGRLTAEPLDAAPR